VVCIRIQGNLVFVDNCRFSVFCTASASLYALQVPSSGQQQPEADDVVGTAGEQRCPDVEDGKPDSSVLQPVDITTQTTSVRPQSDIDHEKPREREPRQTINDERLNHQTAPLDVADSRQVSNSLVLGSK